MQDPDPRAMRLSRPEAARRLGRTTRTLQRWALADPPAGPAAHVQANGRSYYLAGDVEDFLADEARAREAEGQAS